jgi:hypothetical protein
MYRKVKFRVSISSRDLWQEGKFHQWGTSSPSEGVMETIALIEAADGQVHCVAPFLVVFID